MTLECESFKTRIFGGGGVLVKFIMGRGREEKSAGGGAQDFGDHAIKINSFLFFTYQCVPYVFEFTWIFFEFLGFFLSIFKTFLVSYFTVF